MNRTRLWWGYLGLGLLATGYHFALPQGSLEQSLAYDAIGASGVAAILVGIRVHRPDRRLPWLLMALGQALFVAGDLIWMYYEQVGETPFPSLADASYLSGYPFVAAGLFLFIRQRIGGGDRSGLLDAAILTTSAAVLSWTFLMEPALAGSDLGPLELAISAAYPIMDLLLIGVATGLLTTPGARTASFRLLAGSLGLLLFADQVYALQNLEAGYVSGGALDAVYLISYIVFGAAALHPSMRTLGEPHPVVVTWLGPVRLLFLAGAMLTGPALMTIGRAEADLGLWVIAGGSALLSILVLVRLAGLVGTLASDVAHRRALEERLSFQAFHDPLTGLANRRLFVERVDGALRRRLGSGSLAVLFLDLDDFKTVNDELGHGAGDGVLVAVGGRLAGALRATDLAARLGGDEFGVLLEGVTDTHYATTVAERLIAALGTPVSVGGVSVPVGVSIGVALDSEASSSVDDLLRAADVAMYHAKARGKGVLELAVAEPTLPPIVATDRPVPSDGGHDAPASGGRLGLEGA